MSASDSGERRNIPLSDNSTVRLGLVCVLLSYVFGTAWWASSISSKVDSLLTMGVTVSAAQKDQQREIEDLKERVWKLENRTLAGK